MRARWAAAALVALLGAVAGGLVATPAAAAPANVRQAQWYLDALRIPQAQQLTKGAGVVVAVVDSAVDASLPDLAGQVDVGVDDLAQRRVAELLHPAGGLVVGAGHRGGHGSNL